MGLLALGLGLLVAADRTDAQTSPHAQTPLYRVTEWIPIGAPDKWDLLTYEPARHRLYIAHGSETTVVDVARDRVIGQIGGLDGAHGQVVVSEIGLGYADSGATGKVTVFALASLLPLRSLSAAPDADTMIYDPPSHQILVTNGNSQSLSAIGIGDDKVKTIPLGGSPEAGAVDGKGHLFLNMESTQEILRIDTAALQITARWAVPACARPHGMAIDIETHRLFASCANSRLIVVDADSGKTIAALPIGKGSDGAAFDAKRKRIFSSNGEGTLSVIEERDADDFVPLATVATAPGARTMAIDPKTGRIFVVTADVAKIGPPKRPGGPPQFSYIPGSVKLLILQPTS